MPFGTTVHHSHDSQFVPIPNHDSLSQSNYMYFTHELPDSTSWAPPTPPPTLDPHTQLVWPPCPPGPTPPPPLSFPVIGALSWGIGNMVSLPGLCSGSHDITPQLFLTNHPPPPSCKSVIGRDIISQRAAEINPPSSSTDIPLRMTAHRNTAGGAFH